MLIFNVELLRFDSPRTNARKEFLRFFNSAFLKVEAKTKLGVEERKRKHYDQDLAPQADTFTTNETPVTISSSDFPSLDTEQLSLYYIGTIAYTDAFNHPYETTFCYFYFGSDPKTWHVCAAYNSIR